MINDLVTELKQGLNELKLDLNEEQQKQLLNYLTLLQKWNAIYNLSAIREPQAMLHQHLFDSLAIVPELIKNIDSKPIELMDVGSGAGLPGIPLAIAMPYIHVTLIDSVHKKTAFLNQVKANLQLTNVEVMTGRIEQIVIGQQFDVITSRAFSSLANFVNLAQHVLAPQGFFAAMKGVFPEQEIQQLPNEFQVEKTITLKVPLLNAQRCLVFISARHAGVKRQF